MSRPWTTVSVFISSTFRDMHAERDHLVRFVFPRLRQELLSRHIHLVDVDLRWGVTSDQDVSEACVEVIHECRPRFLCLLGGRYGTIPSGASHSITDGEVQAGIFDQSVGRMYGLFYFRHGATTEQMDRSDPGTAREPRHSEKAGRLALLKRRIRRAGYRPFIYRPRWHADEHRLFELTAFGQRVAQDILQTIDDEFDDRPTVSIDEFADERAAMDAFVEERGEGLVLGSRRDVLNDLVEHALDSVQDGYLCLTGPAGSGKSALLAALTGHPALTSALVVYHFVGASAGSTDVRQTVRRLCHDLKMQCPEISSRIPSGLNELSVAFRDFLGRASSGRRVVIVLDAVNQFEVDADASSLHWLPPALPAGARVILSAVESPTLEELRARGRPPREIALRPLTTADGDAIVERFRRRYRKTLTHHQREMLLAKSEAGVPLYLLTALEELRTLGTFEEIDARIEQLPDTTEALFVWVLRRLESDGGFRDDFGNRVGRALVGRSVTLVAASRHGLSYRELTDLVDPGDPRGNVTALLRLLRPYLMSRGALIDFHHSQFKAAVHRTRLSSDEQQFAAHAMLADYFHGQPMRLAHLSSDSPSGRLPPDANRRKLTELAWQRLHARQWPELVALLANLSFLDFAWRHDEEDVLRYWQTLERASAFSMVGTYTTRSCDVSRTAGLAWTPARLLLDAGHLAQAAELWKAIVDSARERDDPELAGALNNLALARQLLRDLDGASKCYTEQMQLCIARHDAYGLQAAFGNMGTVAFDLQRYDQALEFYKQQEQICRALGNDEDLHRTLGNQGNILSERHDFDGALALYRQQEAICRKLGEQRSLYIAVLNQANIAFLNRDIPRATALAEKAAVAFRELGAREYLWGALALIGHIYLRQGQPEAAQPFYDEAEAICGELGATHYLSEMFYKLGNAMLGSFDEARRPQGRFVAGLEEFEARIDLQDRTKDYSSPAVAAFRKAVSLRSDWPEANAQLGLALEMTGQVDEAIAAYDVALRLRPDWPEISARLGSLLVR